ncbi:MAG: ceramidase domain-containing protein [Pseudomonadota bacterium]
MAQREEAGDGEELLMNWNARIDGYCERMSDAFWAEPINAITNAAFIIAAILALGYARRQGRLDTATWFLLATLTAIGIGSFLFHTYATRWAALADVAPIGVFILGYFAIAMHRFVGLTLRGSAIATGILIFALPAVSTVLQPILRPSIGGSVSYIPALLMLICVGAWLMRAGHAAGINLIAAAGIFTASLTFRTLDIPVCNGFPLGTHFAWHILNGTLLGFLIVTLTRHGFGPGALALRRASA